MIEQPVHGEGSVRVAAPGRATQRHTGQIVATNSWVYVANAGGTMSFPRENVFRVEWTVIYND